MIKIYDIVIEQNHFPDNTLLAKVNPYDEAFQANDDINITWHYESDAELFTLICIKRHLESYFIKSTRFNLILPYVPHARMDRVKNPDELFTLKYFCEVINSLHFDNVVVSDVHSNVALALLDNIMQVNVAGLIESVKEVCGAQTICYPDEGAMKRYSSIIKHPYTFGIKKRDWETGKIERLDLVNGDSVLDRDVLIVDDICSYGGTFLHTAKALKEAGANNIYLYITHCEKSIFDGEMINSGLITKIYTTDSIFPADKQNDMIQIIN